MESILREGVEEEEEEEEELTALPQPTEVGEEECRKYCEKKYDKYIRKGAKVLGEGKHPPDCVCIINYNDELGRPIRTERISGDKKTIYVFDPKTGELLFTCGNQRCENQKGENCFNCPQDCKCGSNEICDPFSDSVTKCSPKVAYIYISSGITSYQRAWISSKIEEIRKDYKERGYKTITVDKVSNAQQLLQTLSNPSTKAIAYFGHSTDDPRIEDLDAAILQRKMYEILLKKYLALGMDREEAMKKADERSKNPDLDYAYIHACHSLDDNTLRDYLLRSGGQFSGAKGVLFGGEGLEDSVKPYE